MYLPSFKALSAIQLEIEFLQKHHKTLTNLGQKLSPATPLKRVSVTLVTNIDAVVFIVYRRLQTPRTSCFIARNLKSVLKVQEI